MGTTQGSVRWGIERRLEFIEFRLFWEGHVNRGDLMAAFGISINQASTDLNRYLGMAPGNMVYDKSARAYVRGDRFAPLFLKPDPASYLSHLRSISDGIVTQEETWIGQMPAFDTVPSPVRGIDAHTLRRVIEAIRTRQALEVEYQSLSNPAPRWRWIAPHAIAFDGSAGTRTSRWKSVRTRACPTRRRRSSRSTTACGEARPASASARPCFTTRSSVSGWILTRPPGTRQTSRSCS